MTHCYTDVDQCCCTDETAYDILMKFYPWFINESHNAVQEEWLGKIDSTKCQPWYKCGNDLDTESPGCDPEETMPIGFCVYISLVRPHCQ